ncbi:MAG: ketoacyl-ACP synthase III [Oscillospiraceae bacterium]|nr:ketoacyl-ACP synthase III [Oscillospiraceae bacterium]
MLTEVIALFGIEILGTGSYNPPLNITNDDMAKIVETNDEWISSRTGISSRRIADGEPTWKMGAEAAAEAVKNAGIDPMDIGLIIDTTITNDFYTPSMACVIQNEIGAFGAAAYDLNAACSGFVYAVDAAKRYLQTDPDMKYVLVVANEMLSRITDYTDRSTCVLFGDGAAAAVIGRSEKLFTSFIGADGRGAHSLYAKSHKVFHPFRSSQADEIDSGEYEAGTTYLFQDGKEVYKFATKALPTAANKAAEKIGLDINEVDWFIPHQANIRIIETAAKNIGVSMDKFIVNIKNHGNTSSASIPIALHEAITDGIIKRGDKLCLVGFGAGLTMGAVILEY